jgi:hypothetical protein
MTLPSSGAISMSDVNTEIGRASTAQTSLNDSFVRWTAASVAGSGVLSGSISMSQLYGAGGTQFYDGGFTAGNAESTGVAPYNINGFKTVNGRVRLNDDSSRVTVMVGSNPTTPFDLVGSGITIRSLYSASTEGSQFLYVDGTPTYTGSLQMYFATNTGEWPTQNGFIVQTVILAYAGVSPWGNHFWRTAQGAGTNTGLSQMKTFRLTKV